VAHCIHKGVLAKKVLLCRNNILADALISLKHYS
jgi:hypothetical protein